MTSPGPPATSLEALAHAASSVVSEADLAGILASMLDDCARLLSAHAIGVLCLTPDHSLELLSATSHRGEELELYQVQIDQGPCVDAIRSVAHISSESRNDIARRWPAFGALASALGIGSVHATPMVWQGHVIGGMNLFRSTEASLGDDDVAIFRAFADIATIAVISRMRLSADVVVQSTRAALEGRTVIEQAKGVLAYQQGIEPAAAYDVLKARAREERMPMTELAHQIVNGAASPNSM